MRNFAPLIVVTLAVVLVGCSGDTVPNSANPEQSSGRESLPGESTSGEEAGAPSSSSNEIVEPEEATGSPAPTVGPQDQGSPLAVAGAELAAPDGWQVTGVSSDDSSEVVGATSDDGQFISLRSVRTAATVDEQLAEALEADSEQSVAAPELETDGETLRGVATALTASGGQAIQLRYFVRRGDSLITIDIVTTAEQRDALLDHLRAGITWR